MPTKYSQFQDAIIIYLIQHYEADFQQKVSLKILNSGIILKTFTYASYFVSCEQQWHSQAYPSALSDKGLHYSLCYNLSHVQFHYSSCEQAALSKPQTQVFF